MEWRQGWNDFSQQRTDLIVELATPAVALGRSNSPQRVHRIEPQLGPRPRVVDPSVLQAPQQPSTEYSVWDDTWPTQQYQHHRRFHRHGLPARAAIVRNMLTPVPAIAPDNVAQFPPSNYPYMAFAPWFVNTSMLQAVEFALD